MLDSLRRNKWFFLTFSVAGLVLRGWFLHAHPLVAGDSFVYGDIAKNWLLHGIYAVTEDGAPVPTLIRLPGYPAFLAATWKIAGLEHYTAVLVAQIAVDLFTCFVVAALAFHLVSQSPRAETAAKAGFVLAALCPFTATYAVAALAETLTIFASAAALLCGVVLLQRIQDGLPWRAWAVGCGLASAAAILLRPDSGILLALVMAGLLAAAFHGYARPAIAGGLIIALLALAPLLPWTIRNWRVFHVFQPLAPFHANAPGEYVARGFDRWTGTWLIDFVSVMDVYWKVSSEGPGDTADINALPARAFDSPEERAQTAALFDQYNQENQLSPELDQRFDDLARQRISRHPFRYHVALPLARLADMWLRPRNETMDLDLDWWVGRDVGETVESIALGLINLLYLGLAVLSIRQRHQTRGVWLLWGFILLRSALLLQLVNPEPRYTLESYPAVMALAAITVSGFKTLHRKDAKSQQSSV